MFASIVKKEVMFSSLINNTYFLNSYSLCRYYEEKVLRKDFII